MARRRLAALPRPSRTLAITMLAIVGLVAVLYLATRAITVATYEDIERRDVRSATYRARDALDAEVGSLARTAADYAEWDDAFAFANGNYPDFLDNNSVPEAMQNLGVDFLVVVWPSEHRVDGRFLGSAGHVEVLSEELAGSLEAQIADAGAPLTDPIRGALIAESGSYLVATNPIMDSSRTAHGDAYLAVGLQVDENVVEEVSALTHLSTSVLPPSQLPPPGDARSAGEGVWHKDVFVEPVSEDDVRGSIVVRSVAGVPAFALQVATVRTVHVMGQQSLSLQGIVLAAFGAVACTVVGRAITHQEREAAQRKQAEESLRSSEERHRTLISQMTDAVLGIAPDGQVVFANPEATRMTGLDVETLCSTHLDSVVTRESMSRVDRRMRSGGSSGSFEIDLVHASGSTVPVEVNSSPMTSDDGRVTGVQWIARDVTERKRFERELMHMANKDYVTGLANRRKFEEELHRQVEHSVRSKRGGAVLWLDVDSFKDINDGLGHQAGDRVLVSLAETITGVLRVDSLLARLGGDEFAVLLPEAGKAEAEECGKRVLEAIRRSVSTVGGRRVTVTASMGIVLFPSHATTVEELLARADLAMYYAKEQGRNQCRVHDPGDGWEADQKARLDWIERIDNALAEDRLLAYVQPVMRLSDDSIDRYELLLRMQADDGRILPPSDFMPLAERTGRIREIDRWVVRQGIALISENASTSSCFRLDVNLSGRAFSDPELLALIRSEIARHGTNSELFGVEITETAAVTDMSKAREFINALRDIGCRVALDDFGSGFSSFYYLKNLPIDTLKIDGGFVQQLCANVEDRHVVRAMVELSRGLGIGCTAEWVEDDETLALLREYGVTYAQGFHIARPFPASEIATLTQVRKAG
jgi:diguanylate cyclase (GGDEF)-like protein/PAS domain S-box-containing protein